MTGATLSHAMVLAAGLGTRMRPLTLTTPKPLLTVGGVTMLDRALDHVVRAGVTHAVVNGHYLADQIAAAVAGRTAPRITYSHEDEALETGGGVAKALAHLGDDAFAVANADIVWMDGADAPSLVRLARAWDDAAMDVLLLLVPRDGAFGYDGPGDFSLSDDGRLIRRGSDPTAPFVFAGVQIVHPRAFAAGDDGAFSMNRIFDRALAKGRLFGLVHDGAWYHVGTPDALESVNTLLAGTGR